MKMSHMLGRRTKQDPSDAKLKSHKLLIRGGYIRPVSNGIYSILLPGQKVLRNIERIVREEMNAVEGQEVEMPLVQPKELWEESGRYQSINDELVRLKDRNNHDMVLAMTHEEAAVALARTEAVSYKDYPFMIYQFAKKFRDEARPRGGLIRVREFTMKDAYSFHTSPKDLEDYYAKCAKAYSRIFARAGVPEVVAIKSDSGMMGGNVSHEYMLLTEGGEDTIVTCPDCDYKANKEVAVSKIPVENGQDIDKPLQKIYTPNAKSIEELSEMYFQKKSLQEDYNNEKSSIANWSGIQSTYAQEQIKQAQEKLSEIKKKQNRLDDKIIKNQNIIKEKYKTTDEGEFCGWAIYHRFRYGKNKFLADILIITDKNMENLENSIMIEDYNPLMELIGDKLKEFGFNNNDLNFEQIKQIIDDVLEK